MAEEREVVLPAHYYRDNFIALLASVERQYGNLLNDDERLLIDRFRDLGFDAQCLYIRLLSRVGPWFRESRLSYPELGPLAPALDELLVCGLAQSASTLCAAELGRMFSRSELAALCDELPLSPKVRDKQALLGELQGLGLAPEALADMALAWEGARIVAPQGQDTVGVLQLLFFGNRRQGMTDFVLSDLGVAKYYPYPLNPEDRLFAHRQAVDEYLGCAYLSDCWYESRDAADGPGMVELAVKLLATRVHYGTSQNRWYRLCNGLARDLERLDEGDLALSLYELSQRHPARERRARLLERKGDYRRALALCDDILQAPWCEDELEAAGRIQPRVRRKFDGTRASRRRDDFPRLDLSLRPAEQRVERLAAAALEEHWEAVYYVENQLMNALFGLAFWEQIYAPVPGAFHHAFQAVPADMYDPAFREKRASLLECRLAELAEADLPQALVAAYRQYRGYQCRWINWRAVNENLVELATRIIPRAHLLAVWERMLFDPGENRRGFPDLLALGKTPGQYCLIEVKGPGDALQDSQKRWLRFFQHIGIPCSVAWVEWQDE